MKPNGCGASTKTIKYGECRIKAATPLRAMKSSSRTHFLGYRLAKLQLKNDATTWGEVSTVPQDDASDWNIGS